MDVAGHSSDCSRRYARAHVGKVAHHAPVQPLAVSSHSCYMKWLTTLISSVPADDSYYSTDQSQQISREHRFVFVHVPKTGGTSFERSKVFDDA